MEGLQVRVATNASEYMAVVRLCLRTIKRMGYETQHDVHRQLRDGDAIGFLGLRDGEPEMASVAQIVHYPLKRVLFCTYVGGTGLKDWFQLGMDAAKTYGQLAGCDEIQSFGRRGWEKYIQSSSWRVFKEDI
jgi:hypothetical protein